MHCALHRQVQRSDSGPQFRRKYISRIADDRLHSQPQTTVIGDSLHLLDEVGELRGPQGVDYLPEHIGLDISLRLITGSRPVGLNGVVRG